MDHDRIEEKRNELNLQIRQVLSIVDLIDGEEKEYEDYKTDSLDEIGFLEQQLLLVEDIRNRLMNVFKD